MTRRERLVEDSYDPAPLDVAWAEYRDANPHLNHPDGYAAFRAGFRRGVGQGALLSATTFVHGSSDPRTGGDP